MLPIRIANSTRVLAEMQDEYYALAIRDEILHDGERGMTSLWEPSPAELKLLLAGGFVRLTILGTVHPPLMLSVQEPSK